MVTDMSVSPVRAVVRQGITRGCQAYIIREGWEGLVRGNNTEPTPAPSVLTSPTLTPNRSVSFSDLPPSQQLALDSPSSAPDSPAPHGVNYADPSTIAPLTDAPLSFGFGELLKDGAGEGDGDDTAMAMQDVHGRSLKGRHIVRVGWDDARGWLGEGGTLIGSSRCPSCKFDWIILDLGRES